LIIKCFTCTSSTLRSIDYSSSNLKGLTCPSFGMYTYLAIHMFKLQHLCHIYTWCTHKCI
jgi:uncharacterized membrane protein YcgQ (UPF0703/DUF1980 family)